MEALIKIQSELKAPKGQFNSFGKYKYRSCEDILEALKPLLSKYEAILTIQDEVKEICGVMYLEATATIKQGKESITVKAQAGIDVNKKGMDIAQCFGSSSSYARKYSLNGLFLIDDTKDADAVNDHKDKPIVKEKLTDERFKNALESLSTGETTVDKIEKFDLSETQKNQLKKVLA